jgi:hypothetical protein
MNREGFAAQRWTDTPDVPLRQMILRYRQKDVNRGNARVMEQTDPKKQATTEVSTHPLTSETA